MMFGVTPEALNAVNVGFPTRKFVLMMEVSVVIVTVEDEAVVVLPAIRVNRRSSQDFPLNNRHQLFFRTIWNHRHKHFPISFYQPKHRCFASCTSPSFPTNTPRSKVTFV